MVDDLEAKVLKHYGENSLEYAEYLIAKAVKF